MKLNEIADQSFGLLGQVLDESITLKNNEDMRGAFVYRHARNIYQLGRDVIFLVESSRLDSCPVIVRAMLESQFKLVAAVKQPDAAVQILISEVEDDLTRIAEPRAGTCRLAGVVGEQSEFVRCPLQLTAVNSPPHLCSP